MTPRRKPRSSEDSPSPLPGDADAVLQIKVWLLGVSPMIWRRLLVPAGFTLRELHGVLQIAMGWEGIHLFQFSLRAARYGSWELAASSPEVTLAALRLRRGARFLYEYDLNIPWRREVRIEDRLDRTEVKSAPACISGDGACPPEDCGGPAGFCRAATSCCRSKGLRGSIVPTAKEIAPTQGGALKRAEALAGRIPGAAAICVVADAETGEVSAATILGTFGELPDDFAETLIEG